MKQIDKKVLLETLKKYFSEREDVTVSFLYGSYARGMPNKDSDVDVAIVLSNEGADEKMFKKATDISYELSNILGKETSVLVLQRDFKKPMLYYNAIVLGLPIFVRNKAEYASLVVSAIYQMEDFCEFGKKWQLMVAAKVLRG